MYVHPFTPKKKKKSISTEQEAIAPAQECISIFVQMKENKFCTHSSSLYLQANFTCYLKFSHSQPQRHRWFKFQFCLCCSPQLFVGTGVPREFLIQFPDGARSTEHEGDSAKVTLRQEVLGPLGVLGLAGRLFSPLMELRPLFRNAYT